MTQPYGPGQPRRQQSAADAIVYGWRKLMAQPGPWIGFMALAAVLTGFVSVMGIQLAAGRFSNPVEVVGLTGPSSVGRFLSTVVSQGVAVVVLALLCRGALRATAATRVVLSDLLTLPHPAPVVVVAVAVGVLQALLSTVPVLGVALMGVVWLAVTLVLLVMQDRDLAVVPALRTARQVLVRRTAFVVVLWILVALLNAAGLFFCVIGLLVTVPATVLAQAAALRSLDGRRALL